MNKVSSGVQRDTAEFDKSVPRNRSELNKIYTLNLSNKAKVQSQRESCDLIRERILSFESLKEPEYDNSSQGSFDASIEEGTELKPFILSPVK
jgi:hypothetical protein